ncbi:MAG: RteC domain-containing protein, partial [Bacteroidetes bacterium]|nr:RteC domain-containing protein [Bacteroidota bacterium]
RVKNEVSNYAFPSAEEEIRFFREIKPAFTSEVEYYNLLYHVEIFKPVSREELLAFWLRERQRLTDFIREHEAFYQYYKGGETHSDLQYFTRAGSQSARLPEAKIYDRDANATTGYDYLVTSLLALERFARYVDDKLSGLKEGPGY